MKCDVSGCAIEALHTHNAGMPFLHGVTHWDSPEGQTRSCPNCDVLAAENAKLRSEIEYATALYAESKELADSEWHLLESENAKLRAVVEAAMNFRQSIGPREWPEADCGLSRALDVLPPSDVEGTA